MKNIIVLQLNFIIMSFNFCMAQANTDRSEIDYVIVDHLKAEKMQYSGVRKINSSIGVKIMNVNKKCFIIESETTKESYNENAPKIFDLISNPNIPDVTNSTASGMGPGQPQELFTNESISNCPIITNERNEIIKLNKKYEYISKKIKNIENTMTHLKGSQNKMKRLLEYHKILIQFQDECCKPFINILDCVNNATMKIFSDQGFWGEDNNINILSNGETSAPIKHLNNLVVINQIVRKTIDEYNANLEKVIKFFIPSNVESIQNDIIGLNADIKSFEEKIRKIVSKNPKNDACIPLLKRSKEYLQQGELMKRLNDQLSIQKSFDLSEVSQDLNAYRMIGQYELIKTYKYFEEGNYSHVVGPEFIDSDLTRFTISVKPKEEITTGMQPTKYRFDFRTKGGIKIDFSTGVFMNFGSNDFLDQSYSYEEVDARPDKIRIIQNRSKSSMLPSIGALMHVYKRSGRDINFSGSFGLSIEKGTDLNFHLGGSALFGFKRRFVLTAGLTARKAALLHDRYEVGQIIEKQTAPESIPTSMSYRLGYFFAMTFNLTSK